MARFIYYNVNPQGETLPDCVTRAISLATNTDYYIVGDLLSSSSEYHSCDRLFVGCYSHLLDRYFCLEKVPCRGMLVRELADCYPNSRLLVRMEGHLSTIIDGDVYDIWDCRDEIATDCWIVD